MQFNNSLNRIWPEHAVSNTWEKNTQLLTFEEKHMEYYTEYLHIRQNHLLKFSKTYEKATVSIYMFIICLNGVCMIVSMLKVTDFLMVWPVFSIGFMSNSDDLTLPHASFNITSHLTHPSGKKTRGKLVSITHLWKLEKVYHTL